MDRLAASRTRLAGQARRRSRGSTRRSPASSPITSRSKSSATTSTVDASPRDCARCARRARAIASGCTSSRPIASGCATRRRPACIDDDGRRRARELGVQRLGEIRQLAAGRAGRRRDRAASRGCRASSRARPTGERDRARGRRHRGQRRTACCSSPRNGCSATCRSAIPGMTRADYERAVRRMARHHATRSGSAKDASATTRTAMSTTSRGSSSADTIVLAVEARSCRRESRALDRQPPAARTGARDAGVGRCESSRCPFRGPSIMNGERLPASYANFYIANGVVHRADVQRPERPRGAEHARVADADTPGRRHPRRRSGVGPGHAALPDAAGAGGTIAA